MQVKSQPGKQEINFKVSFPTLTFIYLFLLKKKTTKNEKSKTENVLQIELNFHYFMKTNNEESFVFY